MAGRHHPRRVVDVEADVAAVAPAGLAGVQAHAHADLVAVGPVVPGERALAFRCGRGGVAGRLEGDEEPVALRAQHPAAVALERLAQERAVALEQLAGRPAPVRRSSRVEPSMSLNSSVTVPLGARP